MDSVPYAVPYPWTVSEKQATHIASSHSTATSRKRKGSGFWYLENQLTKSNHHDHEDNDDEDEDEDHHDTTGRMSTRAQRILSELLRSGTEGGTKRRHNDLHDEDDSSLPHQDRHGASIHNRPTTTSQFQSSNFYASPRVPDVPTEDDDDAAMISLAQDGHTSVLLHILKTVDELYNQQEDAGMVVSDVTAKAIIRNCALSVNPSTTPGALDAKEMVLAALQFLSSEGKLQSNCYDSHRMTRNRNPHRTTIISLPLLEATNPTDDADKRTYHKVGDWTWTDFKTEAFGELQLLFDSSPIRREAFVPRFLSDRDEIPLLQRGIIPPSAAPKRKGPAPGYRRNTTTTTTTTTTSNHANTNKTNPSPSPSSR